MRIAQITPGIMPIPPNGWGAVEKIIWEYKNNLEDKGCEVDVVYLDQAKDKEYDIVHIHMANLALLAAERGIPYIFSLHDHHVVHWGKGSDLYRQNLEAMKKSVISFCHAEFLVDFFDETDKLFYLPHGVNSEFFSPLDGSIKNGHRILCLANNGLAGDSSIDRKGFIPAIQAAKDLGMEITVAGPENNRKFFDHYPEIKNYNKLNLVFHNPGEDEILKLYRDHSIFINASSLEAGHPNLTILESIACGLPTIATYEGNKPIPGLLRCSVDKEDVREKILEAVKRYDELVLKTRESRSMWSWSRISGYLLDAYQMVLDIKKDLNFSETRKKHIDSLESAIKKSESSRVYFEPKVDLIHNFINGCYAEIKSNTTDEYTVEFWDADISELVYSAKLKSGHWAKPASQYYRNWEMIVKNNSGDVIKKYSIDLRGKRVLVSFESSSLGDNISWIPAVEEFRKKWDCEVYLSTFYNSLFIEKYPKIKFVSPGSVVNNIYAQYSIGYWFSENGYDWAKHPKDPFKYSLQDSCSAILGIKIEETVANIHIPERPPFVEGDYICIAPHSTAQAKYWNNPNGWQEVIDHYNSRGYKVLYVSKESPNDLGYSARTGQLSGFIDRSGLDLLDILNDIKHCKVFIGLGSGLSWAAWSLKKPVVLVSGFSDPYTEFTTNCERIINRSSCNSCWNRHYFNKGDWNWCPDQKGTERQFECTKSISSASVIEAIDKQIFKTSNYQKNNNYYGESNYFTARIG
jgi:autotransporter strand-loop-strand O-heptosyltransferase